jgi:hypothetical protein
MKYVLFRQEVDQQHEVEKNLLILMTAKIAKQILQNIGLP